MKAVGKDGLYGAQVKKRHQSCLVCIWTTKVPYQNLKKGVDVNIYNESIECKFQLWKARDKVVAEASFYKMVRQEAVNSNVTYLQWIRIHFFFVFGHNFRQPCEI